MIEAMSKEAALDGNRLGQAFVHKSAKIGAGTILYPFAYIGPNVIIGENCIIGPCACIGQAGFGYESGEDGLEYRVHKAGVIIAADVHIGANSCVDQGRWRATFIGKGTRIDNLVHIAHNARVGKNCIIVAHSMIAGSADIGDYAYVAPGALINDHRIVGAGAMVGMGAVVVKADVPDHEVWVGSPAKKLRDLR